MVHFSLVGVDKYEMSKMFFFFFFFILFIIKELFWILERPTAKWVEPVKRLAKCFWIYFYFSSKRKKNHYDTPVYLALSSLVSETLLICMNKWNLICELIALLATAFNRNHGKHIQSALEWVFFRLIKINWSCNLGVIIWREEKLLTTKMKYKIHCKNFD